MANKLELDYPPEKLEVIVISDGRSNAGLDPTAAARLHALQREDPFPVIAVGVGSAVGSRHWSTRN